MKLRPKVIIFLAVIWIIILSLVCIESYYVILGHYRKIENDSVNIKYLQTKNALDRSIDSLRAIALDWAHWTDSYKFLQNHNEEFIKTNLDVFSTYIDGKLNFILFYNNKGDYFFGRAFGLRVDEFVPVPESLLHYINNTPALLKHDNIDNNSTGFIQLEDGYAVITSYPVTDSSAQLKPNGNIIMGYYFNQKCIELLSNTVHMPLNFIPLNKMATDKPLNDIFLKLIYGNDYVTMPVSNSQLYIYTFIKDINNNPIGFLQIDVYRNIYLGGLSTIYRYIIIIALMGIVIIILMWFYLKKVLLNRLFSFDKQIKAITANSDFSKKIAIGGDDELSDIATSNNNLLKIIEMSQEQLKYRLHLNIEELQKLSAFNKNLSAEVDQHISIEEQLKKDRAFLQQGAYYDSLTALPNRFLFIELLNKTLNSAKRSKAIVAVLFIDLDGYKEINDTYGHAVGDMFLQHISQQLIQSLRQTDVAARLGGDEFMVYTENVGSREFLTTFIKRLLKALSTPLIYKDFTIQATASIGVSIYPLDGTTLDDLSKNADKAMYYAKKHGKNAFKYYDELNS